MRAGLDAEAVHQPRDGEGLELGHHARQQADRGRAPAERAERDLALDGGGLGVAIDGEDAVEAVDVDRVAAVFVAEVVRGVARVRFADREPPVARARAHLVADASDQPVVLGEPVVIDEPVALDGHVGGRRRASTRPRRSATAIAPSSAPSGSASRPGA